MRKLIIKTSLFTTPFFILYIITSFLYSDKLGDLIRIGYIPNLYKNYRSVFTLDKEEKFTKLSEGRKGKYKILTIGDSFSEQGVDGYKNSLAQDYSILHVDRYISNNQIQTLINLCNGDFFDSIKVEYVILQNVERTLMFNIENIKMNEKITVKEIDDLVSKHKEVNHAEKEDNFFARSTVVFPLLSLPKYFLLKNYVSSKQVCNYELNTNKLFSNHSNKILFLRDDLILSNINNEYKNCVKLNNLINDIARALLKKNIKLIFFPSSDKYGFYYNYIIEKKELPKPVFFDNFKLLQKDYIYIDSKAIISNYVSKKQDLYYYDDTHWSPIASKIIGENIKKQIEENK